MDRHRLAAGAWATHNKTGYAQNELCFFCGVDTRENFAENVIINGGPCTCDGSSAIKEVEMTPVKLSCAGGTPVAFSRRTNRGVVVCQV